MAQPQELAPPPGSAHTIDQAVNLNPAFVFNTLETWIVTHENLARVPRVRAAFDSLVASFKGLARGGSAAA